MLRGFCLLVALAAMPLAHDQAHAQRDQHAQEPQRDEPGSDPSAAVSSKASADEGQPDTDHESDPEEGRPLGLSPDWWLVIFTGVLTASTAFLWWETRQTSKRQERETAHARRLDHPPRLEAFQIEMAVNVGAPLAGSITIVNEGGSPTYFWRDNASWLIVRCTDTPPNKLFSEWKVSGPPHPNPFIPPKDNCLGPGQHWVWQFSEATFTLTADDVDAIRGLTKTLYVQGVIFHDDGPVDSKTRVMRRIIFTRAYDPVRLRWVRWDDPDYEYSSGNRS